MTIDTSKPSWTHLIRFQHGGKPVYGNALVRHGESINNLYNSNRLFANIIEVPAGKSIYSADAVVTSEAVPVEGGTLLSPLSQEDCPIIRCIGLNYMKHIKEGGRKPPPYPSMFFKPSTCLSSFNTLVDIPKIAQIDQLDYEGELVIVIGKTGKDIPKSEALNYVAGYCACNDVSARTWQRDAAYAGVVPQWGFSKGFDGWLPISPAIVSPDVVGAADDLLLQTFVNGQLRQSTSTSDLLFGVQDIISFLSQGTTLQKGTLIATGTPSGVIMGMKDGDPEKKWLADGDVVRVEIGGIGALENVMRFVK